MEEIYSRQAENSKTMRAAIVFAVLLAVLGLGKCNTDEMDLGATEQRVCAQPSLSSELYSLKARVERLENDLKGDTCVFC